MRRQRGDRVRARRPRGLDLAGVRRPGGAHREALRLARPWPWAAACSWWSPSRSGSTGSTRYGDLMGVTEYNVALVVAMPVVTVVLFASCCSSVGPSVGVYRWVAGLLRRLVGPRAARAMGWILVFAHGVAARHRGAARRARQCDGRGLLGATTPRSNRAASSRRAGLRSGGPGSLVQWDSLGREGRTFTGIGPSASRDRGGGPPARPWSRCVPTPVWSPPRTPSPAPRWRSRTWSGRAASSGRTCSW